MLSALWDRAAARLIGHSSLRQDSLSRARAVLTVDGELADCDALLPLRALEHGWQTTQAEKGRQFRAHAGRPVHQLREILRADLFHSAGGRTDEALRATIGGSLQHGFDFVAMARGMGVVDAVRVDRPEALRDALEAALRSAAPALVEIVVA